MNSLDIVKKVSICVLLLSLSLLTLQIYVVCKTVDKTVEDTHKEILEVSAQVKKSLTGWQEYTDGLRDQLNDPAVKRGVGMLVRSGDDLARTIKKTNLVLDNLNNAITITSRNINDVTIPMFNNSVTGVASSTNLLVNDQIADVARQSSELLKGTRSDIHETSARVSDALGAITASVKTIEGKVNDPSIANSLKNIELATDNANKTLEHVEQKTKQMVKPVNAVYKVFREIGIILGKIFL